ncbi:E3 ubiquitin-protein ligase UBR1 [Rhizophagus irregularis DAOM 181602=DAOM 197198]|uniref:Uncharacterized protein n=2 Tax=Rhizophagus irregularis TaxID=588596 RepID=A0A015JGW5_RHIIW|nr:hypothetical protein RirG_124520 [Rhizophagus irregularis DAOM 197198w]GBC52253.1 E3 ubiquitin-protein ligase UBR1 [Rhizophagus irregularis DAOM 181602=DAOM 197198]CAB5125112.1 unnamed protein product [Rhizophagus irregularis]CAB5188857.1 unnamed protein product [Rhizophagus irregularis]
MPRERELSPFERGQVIGMCKAGKNRLTISNYLWNELEQKIRKRHTRPKNLRELEMALQEEWRRIPSEVYINLIESMPKRINACIESQGWPTKY